MERTLSALRSCDERFADSFSESLGICSAKETISPDGPHIEATEATEA